MLSQGGYSDKHHDHCARGGTRAWRHVTILRGVCKMIAMGAALPGKPGMEAVRFMIKVESNLGEIT